MRQLLEFVGSVCLGVATAGLLMVSTALTLACAMNGNWLFCTVSSMVAVASGVFLWCWMVAS